MCQQIADSMLPSIVLMLLVKRCQLQLLNY